MPPVRWKSLCILTLSIQIWWAVAVEKNMQDPIAMTSDGWRPIVGSRRAAPSYEKDLKPPSSQKAIEIEIVKSENPINLSSTVQPDKKEETSTKSYNNIHSGSPPNQKPNVKVPPHSKYPPKYQTLPPSAVTLGRPSEFGYRKHPVKPVKQMSILIPSTKRKVISRGQLTAHSTRNEVYVHPINYPYLKQGPSNVRTRETQGLGLYGSHGHFTVNQPNPHAEINRFPSLNDQVFEQYKSPGVSFFIPKIKNQQDEYSRNLVPPPAIRNLAEKEKLKNANSKIPEKFKENVAPVIEVHEQFGVKSPHIQENLVHIPLGFDQNFILQKQFKPKPPAVDVQVTKENLKVFHNILPNFKPSAPDLIDYDYQGISTPIQLSKLQTYEVTEGKWPDNPNPYTFNYAKHQDQSQPLRSKQPVGPPSPNPQITNEPIVELNLPPFLPTPFKPDPAYPTSPTQSEASTVFNQVSQKMNRYKSQILSNNPLFFDIKEVSTHYPILGKPQFVEEPQTESPTKENEITNEVTTPADEVTTRKRRRRPQPRRTTTTPTVITSTTTTTEEPQTQIYESQKTQEEVNAETERPVRQRKRPNRYRLPSTSTPSSRQENPVRYRSTTPANEYDNNEEKRVRVRNRQRTKIRGKDQDSDQNDYKIKQTENRNILYRKRRPTTTEMPSNHKMEEADEVRVDNNSKYFHRKEVAAKPPQRITEYDEDSMGYSEEDMSDSSYETTTIYNSLEDFKMVQEHFPATTEEDKITTDNEIEVTTSPSIDNEKTLSTLATTIPTTTSTEGTTTTKANKIKTRPTLFKSNRPRFSVKDYRQRLTQYSSSTTPATTEVKTTSEGSRFRFPSRLRTRPTQSTTASPYQPQEETTTELIIRRRFKPKDPRHSTTENTNIITETNVKSVNTRLRPFDRYKTSTESSGKPKVSIKPSFYSNRRRPGLNLKTKVNEKEVEMEEAPKDAEDNDEDTDLEITTVYQSSKLTTTDAAPLTTPGISDDDYSQRISDLTSSFKTEYDTPGLFKSVAPISRRVPNYFTISTEDPILPIEAFFPGIKEKDKDVN